MHITILALGSYGDIQPCIILGKALKTVGHQVRLVTFENFEPLAAAEGLDFFPVRGDVQKILSGSGGQDLASSGRNPLRMAWSVLKLFGVMAANIAHDLTASELRDTDIIINQMPGGLYGYDLAELLNVPMIRIAVMPLTPTKDQPMLAFPSWLAPIPGYIAFSHWLAYQLIWQGFRPAINRWRQRTLGLSKAPFWGMTRVMEAQQVLELNAFSAHVVPRPSDWGAHVHITGYWFPEEEDWQPSEGLQEFIEAGPAPVFIGFGSMAMRDPQRTTTIVLAALERRGQRAILHMGWGGMGQQELPENVRVVDYVSYGWLFPQMAAVVHHGGSGTTAFGLRAGVPAVIVPFLFDQFYWGKRVAELGVGPVAVPFKKLSVERLAQALSIAVNDSQMRQRAAALGEQIRAEDGLSAAVALIQRYLV